MKSSMPGRLTCLDTYARARLQAALVLLWACCIAGALGHSPMVHAQQAAAQIISPVDGAVDFDSSQPVVWTRASGALAYYLYVGTTPGAKDLINTGEIQATQYSAAGLPGGSRVYARLHTKFADGWKWHQVSFVVRSTSVLLVPANDSPEVDPRVNFQWTRVTGGQAYYLKVGTSPGMADVVNSGETQSLSFTPRTPLPAGRTLYARMHVRKDGAWRFSDSVFTTKSMAALTAPLDGATDVDTRGSIHWTKVDEALAYYLYVGSTPGAKDLINTGEISATSFPMISLPGGRTVHARIYTKLANKWVYADSSFTTRAVAQLLSPRDGAQDVSSGQLATWTAVSGATAYYLTAGSSLGGRDYLDSGEITSTSYRLPALHSGASVYLRLYTKYQGAWRSVDATVRTVPRAQILAPAHGATNVARHTRINWSTVPDVQAYYLYVGTTPGAKDLVNTGETLATSYQVNALPAGQTVYARMWTKRAGHWEYSDTTFTTQQTALLQGVTPGTSTINAGELLNWESIPAADRYYLYVGSVPGANDLINSGELTSTSYSIRGLVGGRTVYVRLYTRINGLWLPEDYVFSTAPLAHLLEPAAGATAVDLDNLILTWSAVDGASAYRVQIGSSQGLGDQWDSSSLSSNSVGVPPLPGGRTLHVRTWAQKAGVWRYSDTQFTGQPMSQLRYPINGSTDVDTARPFEWTGVSGASGYSLRVGTTPGGADLAAIANTSATSAVVANIPMGVPLYVRVGSRTGATWRYVDHVLRAGGTIPTPTLVYPSASGAAISAASPFEWTRDPLALSYRLTIGTSAGASDVHDSGDIRVNRRFARSMPQGQLLHARLTARYLNGTNRSTDFSFEVASNTIPASASMDGVRWATQLVRSMAATDNLAYANTVLADIRRVEAAPSVNCVSYALALLAVLDDLGSDVQARTLGVCLNTNQYDCHTLVEVLGPNSGRWELFDPTFGFAVRRSADGASATSADVSSAARSFDWNSLSYEYLTDRGDYYATNYYLDYPTMFVNVYVPRGGALTADPPATILPYYEFVGASVSGVAGRYALQCPSGQQSVRAIINGSEVALPCSSSDRLTHIFLASNVAAVPGGAELTIYRARRFTF